MQEEKIYMKLKTAQFKIDSFQNNSSTKIKNKKREENLKTKRNETTKRKTNKLIKKNI